MKFGLGELLIIFIVALVVLGPDKLPLYAKKLGEAIGKFKDAASEATRDLKESVVDPLEEAQKPLREAMDEAQAAVHECEEALKGTGKKPQHTKTVKQTEETNEARRTGAADHTGGGGDCTGPDPDSKADEDVREERQEL